MATRQEILAAAGVIEAAVVDPDGRRLSRASAEHLAELILAAAENAREEERRTTVAQMISITAAPSPSVGADRDANRP